MKQYQITLNEEQLQLLSHITDFAARFTIGQIGMMNWPYEAQKQKTASAGLDALRTEEAREKVNDLLTELRKVWWGQGDGSSFGVKFSPESDTLFDMHEVIRHELWKQRGRQNSMVNCAFPAHHWNKESPLIEVFEIGLAADGDATTTLEPSAGKLQNPDGIPF